MLMSTSLDLNHAMVEAIKPECTARLFGLGRAQIKVPDLDPDHWLFHVPIAADGTRQIKPITPQAAGGRIPGNPYDLLARVRRHCAGFPLPFPRRHTDAQGQAWDFVCTGTLTVSDAQRFAERGLGLASVGAPLRRDRLAAWLAQDLDVPVADCLRSELSKHSFEDLRDKHILPAEWWSKQLGPALERFGLQLTGLAVRWESADARRAEEGERDRQAQARVQKQVEDVNRQCLEQAQREAEHARRLAEIEAYGIDQKRDLKTKGVLGQDQVERVEEECRKRRLQAEQKFREEQVAGEKRLLELQWAIERQAKEHEFGMIALREKAERERETTAEAQRRVEQEAERKAGSRRRNWRRSWPKRRKRPSRLPRPRRSSANWRNSGWRGCGSSKTGPSTRSKPPPSARSWPNSNAGGPNWPCSRPGRIRKTPKRRAARRSIYTRPRLSPWEI